MDKIMCNKWKEISIDEYWHFLECLPPIRFTHNSFFIREATTGLLHDFFITVGDRHYKSLQHINKPLTEIKNSLNKYLEVT